MDVDSRKNESKGDLKRTDLQIEASPGQTQSSPVP